MKNPITVSILGIAVAGIAFGLINPVVIILLEKNNNPAWLTGLVTTVGYSSIVLFSSITGRLIDKYNVKLIMKIGFLIIIVCSLFMIYWRNIILLFPVRFLIGVGMTFVFVTTEVIINYSSKSENRSKNIGLYVIFLSLGIAIGTMLIWTVEIDELIPFLAGAAIVISVYIYEHFNLDDIPLIADEKIPEKMKLTKMPLLSLLSAIIYGFFESAGIVVIPIFGLRNGFSQTDVSVFLTAYVVGGIILLWIFSSITDKFNRYKTLLFSSMILSIFLLIPILSVNYFVLTVSFFLMGGIIPAFYTVGLAYTTENVENKFLSQSNGHFAMFYGIGTLFGPLVGASLVDLNHRYGFWLFGLLLCLIFFSYFWIIKRKSLISTLV